LGESSGLAFGGAPSVHKILGLSLAWHVHGSIHDGKMLFGCLAVDGSNIYGCEALGGGVCFEFIC
jgi:hypothetical protein